MDWVCIAGIIAATHAVGLTIAGAMVLQYHRDRGRNG